MGRIRRRVVVGGVLCSEEPVSSGCEEVLSNISLGPFRIFQPHQLGGPPYPTRLKKHRCRRNDPCVSGGGVMEDVKMNKHAEPPQQKIQRSGVPVKLATLLKYGREGRQGPATCSTTCTYITCPSRPEFLPLQVAVYVGIKI